MITVFYDGACGLCAKEINHYRKIAAAQCPDGTFDWQDITQSTDELEKTGVSLAEGLRLLHAKDSKGQLHIGVGAFILIWKQFAGWRILAALVDLPIIRQTADVSYRAFASWRFKRLPHCQLALKSETNKPSKAD